MINENGGDLRQTVKPLAPEQAAILPSHRRGATQEATPTFFVRDVPVFGDVILAPMAGFADVPTRAICRRFGSAMNYSEFVAAEDIVNGASRAMSLLDFTADDRPMVFQIFGNDAQSILLAAQRIEDLGPDIIDINMGCSTRRVSGRGAGVGMMRDPQLVAETFRLLNKHLSVPVTGKIRLGWEDNQNYLEVARILDESGAALIALHPRTKEQQYRGAAQWEAIAALCEAVNVPVIGNGDVVAPQDVDRMKSQTGCQAVMIGRGAIGNPWLFARTEKETLMFSTLAQLIEEHLDLMVSYYGERGLVLFRKHLKRYLAGMPALKESYRRMVTAGTVDEVSNALAQLERQYGDQKVGELMG
ncbi:MAG: tRNA-dihydrouridine synthase family protein [Chloroflexota bacterium]|nr:MAG: tRNA-dihydrouridine synthase family protein [Chloroflexota bacterium]